MTKADLLTLQDAAEEFSLESAENLGVNKSVCLQTAALAILCRVVSSLMAGEGENRRQELHERFKNRPGLNAQMDVQAPPSIDDYAPPSSGEFERGWNEAIEACLERIRRKYQYTVANPLYAANYPSEANAVKDMRDLVRALRKPAQEEVK